MIQHVTFENGSYALHRIPGDNGARYSAWYAANGDLLDAECIDRRGRSRHVPHTATNVRSRLAVYGRHYAAIARATATPATPATPATGLPVPTRLRLAARGA